MEPRLLGLGYGKNKMSLKYLVLKSTGAHTQIHTETYSI
jgi:hypothetical protein